MTKPGRPLLSLLLAFPLMAGAAFAQTPERPPAKAGYMTLEQAEVPVIMNLTGRAVAVNTAQIRPRVSGMIREILYTPGSYVEAGTPLFAIDPLTYEIALRVAEANLERAKADLSTAQSAFERAEKLQGQQATSRATFETVETTLLKARASLSESEARLALAKAELEWTVIRAPASGVAGIATVAVGDLVSASQTALTEIVQTDPILVDLTEPYPTRLRLESAAAEGRITLQDPALTLVLNDGSRIEGKAKLVSTGATVSATTGTRRLRFEMENPSGRVSPGMFVQGEMTLGRTEAILVPQRAAVRQRDGSLTAWIAMDGKATRRPIEENGTWKNHWVVTDGLEAGEWLLVDGIAQIRDGQPVELTPAAIDADGVVRDSDPAQVGN
ncbi:efflux RND transporter periplasmic adaptor subunit [Falsigemmobacter intermedius]|uniref:Efflux RND transporter periplasmic adaptor subunit n=1 Tax=Falsigemmobacter intermedius TaxID=1553448 RepID=A0A444MA66_9RHOB|nr:efflux RND transporter periplasmic adaptor subunit [Falsigemmobacter intermedius]RWY40059.1 efflux RND transporter periplasmic adaptor subunit [Falsigemmobacter intermedius]